MEPSTHKQPRSNPDTAMTPLPIDPLLPKIVASFDRHPNLVLEAPTGAGKTTRVPPALLQAGMAGNGRILMLEPRRIAARAAARRIAEENGWRLGEEVGYHVRFDKTFSARTRILVVTEGILVGHLQRDPFLEGISVLVFDEVHERNLQTDLSLAMARRVQREVRQDLKILAMSATLEAGPMQSFLGDCPAVESRGRGFPVEIHYLEKPDDRPLPERVAQGVRQAIEGSAGDLLVFLPGVGEIRRTSQLLAPMAQDLGLALMELYGDLGAKQQDAILGPGKRRKVVLATNVAETSLTIDGISAVVDSGLAKIMRFDSARGLDRLDTVRISSASAEQRAGRAGRQKPGYCLRLWTEHEHRGLAKRETPEILRVDLAATALQLLAWGERDLHSFDWLEAPDPAVLSRALRLLSDLEAKSPAGLSELGRRMARLPLHPRLARLVLEGTKLGVGQSASLAAALLSERDVVGPSALQRKAQFATGSDLIDRLDAVQAWVATGRGHTAAGPIHRGRAKHLLRVAEEIARSAQSPDDSRFGEAADEALSRALLAAFPDRLAKRREKGSERALLVGGRGVRLAESSSVREADLFLALDVDSGRCGERSEGWVRMASSMQLAWLPEAELTEKRDGVFDPKRQRAIGQHRLYYRDLVLSETEVDLGQAEAELVLGAAASADLEQALPLADTEVAALLNRCRWLAGERPDLAVQTFGVEKLRELLPTIIAGCRSFAQTRRAPLLQILRGSLGYSELEQLDRLAPERIEVPSGSRIRLVYEPGKPPLLAVRIQEIFGLAEHPRLAGGRTPVLLHLLAPNRRPQQVTQDLESFWKNTYPEIKRELQGRYPKHAWPEDPLSARAERKPRRRPS